LTTSDPMCSLHAVTRYSPPERGWFDREYRRIGQYRSEAARVEIEYRTNPEGPEFKEAQRRFDEIEVETDRLYEARRLGTVYRVREFPRLSGAPDLFVKAIDDATRAPGFEDRPATAAEPRVDFDDLIDGFGT
jgi:hypothetical protein